MQNLRRIRLLAALVAATSLFPVRPAAAGVEIGAELRLAVHQSFGLPEPDVDRIVARGLPADELAVVGLIAVRAGVSVDAVIGLRREGLSYLDISLRYGPGPEIFYVPFDRDPGPPYGKAWGYFKKTPRERWRTIRLTDREIVDLANVRLAADAWGVSPRRVVELHGAGRSYGAIHHELHGRSAAAPGQAKKSQGAPAGKGKPDEAGRKKDKGKPPL